MNPFQSNAVADVLSERFAQDRKWGEQNHDPMTFLAILMEEVGELSKAALEMKFPRPLIEGSALNRLREEAVQVAAVALAIVENLDREKWVWPMDLPRRVGAAKPPRPLHPKAEQRAEWEKEQKKEEARVGTPPADVSKPEIELSLVCKKVGIGTTGTINGETLPVSRHVANAVAEMIAGHFQMEMLELGDQIDLRIFVDRKKLGEEVPSYGGPVPDLEFSVLRNPGDAAEGIFRGENFYTEGDEPSDIVEGVFKKYFGDHALDEGDRVDFRVFANKYRIGEIPF